MEEYIPKSAVVAEIERRIKSLHQVNSPREQAVLYECKDILSFINTLDVKEVDLEKLGEIARHLIAVKEHIEDMRLDKEEWLMLEKIGYPKNLKHRKEKSMTDKDKIIKELK